MIGPTPDWLEMDVEVVNKKPKVDWESVRRGFRLSARTGRTTRAFALKKMPTDGAEGRRDSRRGSERE